MAQPVFNLPLEDAGDGSVSLSLVTGSGSPTFTRATAATCRQWKPYYLSTGERVTLDLDFVSSEQLNPRVGSQTVTFTRSGTATRVNQSGNIEAVAINTPRFDYDPVTRGLKGLLIEESRTNLVLHSEDLLDAYWSFSNITRTDSGVASPIPGVNFTKVECTTTGATTGVKTIASSGSAANGVTYSVFVKKGSGATEANRFNLYNNTQATNIAFGTFDYDTGVFTLSSSPSTSSASVTSFGGGVYRIQLTAAGSTMADGNNINLYVGFAGGQHTAGEYMLATGVQLEQGQVATSYIPTIDATLSRGVDVVNIASLGTWFNAFEGTMLTEFSLNTSENSKNQYTFAFNTDGNNMIAHRKGNGSSRSSGLVFVAGVSQADFTLGTLAVNTTYRSALAWKANDFAEYLSTGVNATDGSGTLPAVTNLNIGAAAGGSQPINGHIRRLTYSPQRIVNANLATLVASSPTLAKGSNLVKVNSGVARSHYRADGTYIGYLSEGARTNLALRSEEFDNASWSKLNATVTANAVVAPDGTTTADKIIADATTNQHGVHQTTTVVANQPCTQSVFAKAGEYSWLYMTEANNVTAQASFNLVTGALGTVSGTGTPSATIEPWGNGWYRCTLTFTPTATSANIQVRPQTANGASNYLGDGVSGIYAWGAQMEQAAYGSSYIPTTTASAARNVDVLTFPLVISGNVTLYAEYETPPYEAATFRRIVSLNDGTGNEEACIAVSDGGAGAVLSRAFYIDGGVVQGSLSAGVTSGLARVASSGTANDFNISTNGSAIVNDNAGTWPATITTIAVGHTAAGSNASFTASKNIRVWDSLISDNGLVSLSSGGEGDISTDSTVGKSVNQPFALLFDGSDDVVTITNQPEIDLGTGDVSFECEIFTPASGPVNRGIIQKGSGTFNTGGTGFEIRQLVNTLQFGRGQGSGTTTAATFTVANSTTYHVIARYRQSDGRLQFVINGVPQTHATTTTNGNYVDSYNLLVGRGFDGFWNSRISNVRLYKKYLSTEECVELFHNKKATLPISISEHGFELPLNDLGNGEVNLVPSRGTGSATFTRATVASCRLSDGLLKKVSTGVPRSHYLSDGTYAGYLAEGARTNLCLQSEDFGTTWALGNGTRTLNTTVAPDGTTTADTFTENAAVSTTHSLSQAFTISAGVTHVISCFVKRGAGSTRHLRLEFSGATHGFRANVNVDTGAIASALGVGSGTVVGSGSEDWGNGWFRFWVVGTCSSETSVSFYLRMTETLDGSITYNGDNTSSLIYWGAQLEAAIFASTYIPTTTTSVTRNADALTYPSTGNVLATGGSLYLEATSFATGLQTRALGLHNGGGAERVLVFRSTTPSINVLVTDGGVTQSSLIPGDLADLAIGKISARWAANDFAASLNGGTVVTDVSGTLPDITTIELSSASTASAECLFGTLKNVRIWNKTLSNGELESITSGGLVGKWDLDEGTGTSALDLSGKGNNGVLTGATWQI